MLRKTLLSIAISSLCFSASALEILEYDQYAEGNIGGVVPVDTQKAKGDFKVNVTGASRPYAFSLEKTETGIDIILSAEPIDGPAGFIVGVESGKATDRRTFSVNAGSAPFQNAHPFALHTVKNGDSIATVAGKYKQLGGTTYQRIMAMILLNKDVFVSGDINRLELGTSLAVPNDMQVQSLDRNASRRQFMALAKNDTTLSRLTLSLPGQTTIRPVLTAKQPARTKRSNLITDVPSKTSVAAKPAIDEELLEHINMLEAKLATLELRQNVMSARYEKKLVKIMTMLDTMEIGADSERELLVQND